MGLLRRKTRSEPPPAETAPEGIGESALYALGAVLRTLAELEPVASCAPAPCTTPFGSPSAPQELLACADRALYRAKSEGRDLVVASAP